MKISLRSVLLCIAISVMILIAATASGLIANDLGLLNDSAEIEIDNQNDIGYNISVYYSPVESVANVSYTGTVNNQTQQYESIPNVPVGNNVSHVEPTNAELLEKVGIGPRQSYTKNFDNWDQGGIFIYIIESSDSDVIHVDAIHCSSGNPEYYFEADMSGYSLSSWTCNDGLF